MRNKKFVCSVLAVLMVFALLPAAAFAEEDPAPSTAAPETVDITVTYDFNYENAEKMQDTKTVAKGSKAEFILIEPELRDEWNFKGWALDKITYKAGDTLKTDEDITLKAIWEQRPIINYTINFDANGGTGAPEPQVIQSRARRVYTNLTDKTPTKEGTNFGYWSIGDEQLIMPGDVVFVDEQFPTITLHAVWGDSNPRTADDSNMGLWSVLALVSLMGVGAALLIGRKSRQ